MYRQVLQNISFLLIVALGFFSCKKDKPDTGDKRIPTAITNRVLIVCEGSLGNGNAELSVYFPGTDSIFNNVYRNTNATALGDVFQSVSRIGNEYFLCINNSDKIVVLNMLNWQQVATVNVPKPRYLLKVGEDRAYAGSLFSNRIYVINTKAYTVEKEIEMPYQNVEGLLLKDGMVYACCWDTACSKLYRINPLTDELTDSIALIGAAPQSIVTDKENKLWVLGGNVYKNKNAHLNRIDPVTFTVLRSFSFGTGVEAIKPGFNASKDSLYFLEVNYAGGPLHNGVYRMGISDISLPSEALVSCAPNQYFWALGIDPHSGKLFVGDPKGFVQKGTVSVYDPQGKFEHKFNTGLGVGAFYFD